MEELRELPPFLTHESPQVRLQACQIILGFSSSKPHQSFFRTMDPPLIPRMRSLLSDDNKDVAKVVVQSLVNLADDTVLRNIMIDCGTINVVINCLKTINDPNHSYHVMLLQNLTIDLKGAEKFSQEHTALEGLNTRLLLQWITDTTRENIPNDPMQYLANVLCNISQCASVRKLLANPERDILKHLKDQLRSKNPIRRLGVLNAIKNLFHEQSIHSQLLSEDLGLFAEILVLILGSSTIDDDDSATFLAEVLVEMGPAKRPDSDPQVRKTVLDIIELCCNCKESRVYMKSIGTYVLVRELHKFEKTQGHSATKMEEIDNFIENSLVQWLCRPEEGEKPLAPPVDAPKTHKTKAPLDPEEALGNNPNNIPLNHPGLVRF